MLWSLLRSSLPEHLQHLGRSIGAIASVQQVLCVGHDKSARLVSSEERTHLKSRTGVNRTDVRLAVTAIMFMHTTVYVTHILFTQSRAECTLGLRLRFFDCQPRRGGWSLTATPMIFRK